MDTHTPIKRQGYYNASRERLTTVKDALLTDTYLLKGMPVHKLLHTGSQLKSAKADARTQQTPQINALVQEKKKER